MQQQSDFIISLTLLGVFAMNDCYPATLSACLFYIAQCDFGISVEKWPQVAHCLCFFSHLLQCDHVHRQLQLMPWVPPTHRIAFLKSPGKCCCMEMYTMFCGLMWRANEVSKVSLIWNTYCLLLCAYECLDILRSVKSIRLSRSNV